MASSTQTSRPRAVFSTLGCPELSLAEVFALVRRHNLGGVEIRALEGRMDLPALFREQYGEPSELRKYAARAGVEIVSLDSSFKLAGAPEGARDELLAFAGWAEGIGAPFVRVFDGGAFASPLPAEYLAEAVGSVRWWRAEREKRGWTVDIMVETHDALCTGANCRALWDAAGVEIPVLWDAHHTWRKAGEAVDVTWEALRGHVPHIHYKDSVGKPSARHPFTYVLPGEGEFPLGDLARVLRQDAYGGVLSLEWERQWHPYLAPVDEALGHPGQRAFLENAGA